MFLLSFRRNNPFTFHSSFRLFPPSLPPSPPSFSPSSLPRPFLFPPSLLPAISFSPRISRLRPARYLADKLSFRNVKDETQIERSQRTQKRQKRKRKRRKIIPRQIAATLRSRFKTFRETPPLPRGNICVLCIYCDLL